MSTSDFTDGNLFHENFCSLLWDKLSSGQHESISKILKEETQFSQYSIEIVPVILKALYEDFSNDKTEESIEKILFCFALNGNPKETLMVFLEQLELCPSYNQLKVLLGPLQCVLLQSIPPKGRNSCFTWAFNAIHSHISSLNLPEDYNLEGDEVKLLDCHPDIYAMHNSLKYVGKFFSYFHKKTMTGELEWVSKRGQARENLSFHLLQYLSKPFLYLDVYNSGTSVPSAAYDECKHFVLMINELLINPLKTFKFLVPFCSPSISETELDEDSMGSSSPCSEDDSRCLEEGENEESNHLQFSLGTYYYCIFSQNIGCDIIPCVYSPVHIYLKCVSCCLYLMQKPSNFPLQKGLLLLQSLLKRLDEKVLSRDYLEVKDLLKIPKMLSSIVIYSQNLSHRKEALEAFKSFLKKFDDHGKIVLFHNLLTYKHSGFVGLVIHEFKECIVKDLKSGNNNSYFLGDNLKTALLILCEFDVNANSSLFDRSDKDMAILNLLLFLILWDKNKTSGVHDILPEIKNSYLEPLHSDIIQMKEEIRLCLDMETKKKSEKYNPSSICNERIPIPNPTEPIESMKSSLTWLDLIESVWAKVSNLVN